MLLVALILMAGFGFGFPSDSARRQLSTIPANAILAEDGTPILTEAGEFMVTE